MLWLDVTNTLRRWLLPEYTSEPTAEECLAVLKKVKRMCCDAVLNLLTLMIAINGEVNHTLILWATAIIFVITCNDLRTCWWFFDSLEKQLREFARNQSDDPPPPLPPPTRTA